MNDRRIVAAAIVQDGVVWSLPQPARHHDIIRHMYDMGVELTAPMENYGFIDSEGSFQNRKISYHIAFCAGQITKRRPGPENYQGDSLFSEDVW